MIPWSEEKGFRRELEMGRQGVIIDGLGGWVGRGTERLLRHVELAVLYGIDQITGFYLYGLDACWRVLFGVSRPVRGTSLVSDGSRVAHWSCGGNCPVCVNTLGSTPVQFWRRREGSSLVCVNTLGLTPW